MQVQSFPLSVIYFFAFGDLCSAGTAGTVRVLHAKLAVDLATIPILNPSSTHSQVFQSVRWSSSMSPTCPAAAVNLSYNSASNVQICACIPSKSRWLPAGGGTGSGAVAYATWQVVAARGEIVVMQQQLCIARPCMHHERSASLNFLRAACHACFV